MKKKVKTELIIVRRRSYAQIDNNEKKPTDFKKYNFCWIFFNYTYTHTHAHKHAKVLGAWNREKINTRFSKTYDKTEYSTLFKQFFFYLTVFLLKTKLLLTKLFKIATKPIIYLIIFSWMLGFTLKAWENLIWQKI